jgi:hypothetical protein
MSKLPAKQSTMVANLRAAKAITPVSTGGDFQYLKMTKVGEWVYGAEETEVGANSAFVIDPNTYAQGYVAWHNGELIAEQMSVAGEKPVVLADCPELPAGVSYDAQVAFALKGIEGSDEGVQLLYKVSSKGGKAAISTLLEQIIERGEAGEQDLCPIVVLDTSSYKHKKYGKIYTPVMTVDEWVDLPDGDSEPVAEPVAALAEPVVEPAAKPTRKRARA